MALSKFRVTVLLFNILKFYNHKGNWSWKIKNPEILPLLQCHSSFPYGYLGRCSISFDRKKEKGKKWDRHLDLFAVAEQGMYRFLQCVPSIIHLQTMMASVTEPYFLPFWDTAVRSWTASQLSICHFSDNLAVKR